MREIIFSFRFQTELDGAIEDSKHSPEEIFELLDIMVDYLSRSIPLPDYFDDHELEADWFGNRDAHLGPDLVVIYRLTESTATFRRIGRHKTFFRANWVWKKRMRAKRGRGI
jgi:mRNA interferase YafQ